MKLNRYVDILIFQFYIGGPDKEEYTALFLAISRISQTIPYDGVTQKNHLNETILLSTHNIGLEGKIRVLEHAELPLSRAQLHSIFLSKEGRRLNPFQNQPLDSTLWKLNVWSKRSIIAF